MLASLISSPPGEQDTPFGDPHIPEEWLAPLPTPEETLPRHHTDVSSDTRYTQSDLTAAIGNEECTAATDRIPNLVLPT
jgi:hypothetical protein